MLEAGVVAAILLVGGLSVLYAIRLKRLTRRSLTWLLIAGALAVAIAWHTARLVPHFQGGAVPSVSLDFGTEVAALAMFVLAFVGLVLAIPLFETARKTEEALHETEQRYKNLFDNAHVGIYRTTPDGRILVANPALMRMLGCATFEELARRNLEREGFGPGYSRRQFRELVERPGGVRGLEAEWVREDGQVIVIRENAIAVRDSKGNVLYYEGTVEDITERVRAEHRLAQSEARHRQLVELAPFGIAVHRDGKGLFVNPAAARIVGVDDPDEFVGRDVLEYVHPEDRSAADQRIRRVTEAREVIRTFAVRYVRPDGGVVHVEAANAPIDYEGQPAVMTVFQDVTERRRAEELERLLARARKMEALGRLAGGIAHDFNNLLTAIIGFASLLKEKTPPDDPGRPCVDEIVKAANRAAALTGQLLSFSRRQVVEPRVLDLNQVIRDMETLLRRLIGEDVTLEADLDPDLAAIRMDQSQMEQVIVNLAVNARDAMPHGGTLTLATRNEVLTEPRSVREDDTIPPGSYVQFVIEDTGTGMDGETMSHLFEPFFTTKEVGSGTGLGLSTVYGIVRQSGGHVAVRSTPGRGTRFEMYYPVVERKAPPPDDERTPPDGLRGTETVLLVEDEDAVRDLATRVLARLGYHVVQARNGVEALEKVRTTSRPVSLVVTDVVMPFLSGAELVRRVRELHPGLRALFISGYSNETIARNGVLGPETAYLQKPFTPDDLAVRVRRLLDTETGTSTETEL